MIFYIFTLHPTYQLQQIADTNEQLQQIIKDWKKTYPDVPVYYVSVTQG
jgi:hypothetical protein